MEHQQDTTVSRAMRAAFRDVYLHWFAAETDILHAWLFWLLDAIEATDFSETNLDSRPDPHVRNRLFVPLDSVMDAMDSPVPQASMTVPVSPFTVHSPVPIGILTAAILQALALRT